MAILSVVDDILYFNFFRWIIDKMKKAIDQNKWTTAFRFFYVKINQLSTLHCHLFEEHVMMMTMMFN